MRRIAQRVQKQDVKPAQLLQRFRRNHTVIGQIRGRPEAETEDREVTGSARPDS